VKAVREQEPHGNDVSEMQVLIDVMKILSYPLDHAAYLKRVLDSVMPRQTHQLRICTPTVSLMVVRRVDFAGFAWFRRLKTAIGREIKPSCTGPHTVVARACARRL
jgi:hypothetical protein